MDSVFEALLFLAIGLIAITIAVFVLAVSLLGRAIKISLQEQAETAEKLKKENDERIQKIEDQLKEAKTKGHVDVEKLRNELETLEKQQKKQKNKLYWIKNKPALLRVDGGVLLPGVLFIISIIFIVIGRYFVSQDLNSNVVGYLVGAVGFVILGMIVIIQSLKVIESIAITSEEAAFVREAEALKKALKDIEEEKRPELEITFKNMEFPLHVAPNAEIKFQIELGLKKADIAEDVSVNLYIHPELNIVREKFSISNAFEECPKYKLFTWKKPIILKGMAYTKYLTIVAPSKKDTYKIAYYTVCKNALPSETKEIEVIVEELEDLPF